MVIKYVEDEDFQPTERLEHIEQPDSKQANSPFATLDQLYTQILSEVPDQPRLLNILHLIIHSKPIPLQEMTCHHIERYLKLKPGDVHLTLRCLHAVLALPESDEEMFKMYHASFHDFLMDEARSGIFYVDDLCGHLQLAQCILDTFSYTSWDHVLENPDENDLLDGWLFWDGIEYILFSIPPSSPADLLPYFWCISPTFIFMENCVPQDFRQVITWLQIVASTPTATTHCDPRTLCLPFTVSPTPSCSMSNGPTSSRQMSCQDPRSSNSFGHLMGGFKDNSMLPTLDGGEIGRPITAPGTSSCQGTKPEDYGEPSIGISCQIGPPDPNLLQDLQKFAPPFHPHKYLPQVLAPQEFYDVLQWLQALPNPLLEVIDCWKGYLATSREIYASKYPWCGDMSDDKLEGRWIRQQRRIYMSVDQNVAQINTVWDNMDISPSNTQHVSLKAISSNVHPVQSRSGLQMSWVQLATMRKLKGNITYLMGEDDTRDPDLGSTGADVDQGIDDDSCRDGGRQGQEADVLQVQLCSKGGAAVGSISWGLQSKGVWTETHPDNSPHHQACKEADGKIDTNVRCSWCTYVGPQLLFPWKTNLMYLKHVRHVPKSWQRKRVEKHVERDGDKEDRCTQASGSVDDLPKGNHHGLAVQTHEACPTLSWDVLSGLLEKHSKEAFELDVFIELPEKDETEMLANESAQLARNIAKSVWDCTAYRFM
ncbi:hypothetical protein B0H10DRAFT_1953368 [Mycena sp. CBHHK59/15]|nr:hypothetical protein B0H10DRAFT_1953368 [Mycena sp. CBHHK59/15]